ncbi:hypothetical protein GYMLUDRAFT_43626 [Collybiopsis luxurians FD-317 M1]|uniref:Alpha/beta hydrolase fold-3 domain-containing protein n=1 Tax=Collybiopsis luxurians FD-317 M1 TaxID=944289 RepID=A0A0D0CW62_9AGAR|nr:hypothetical protein GYMLUDRAFT_43626 [Collybiopsis luxurians FD-317 M1]
MAPTEQISFLEKLSALTTVLRLPFRVLTSIILSPFLKQYNKKPLNRVTIEAVIRFLFDSLSFRQLQWASGPSVQVYKAWAKARGIQPIIEEFGGNAKLLWLTEKKSNRVLFYVHGGGYMVSINKFMLTFGPRIREELLKREIFEDFDIVVLAYTLYPAKFPTQLDELSQGLAYILSSGIKQENVILMGDSAGGNLIVQLLSHTLHPFEGVTPSPLQRVTVPSSPEDIPIKQLGGVYLLSPWQSLDTPTPSYAKNSASDVVSPSALLRCGKTYLEGVPESHLPWIKTAYCAPDSKEPWFTGLDEYVGRVMITAGGKEVLLDDSTGLYSALKTLATSKLDVQLDVQEDGIHGDPIFDASFPQKAGGLGDVTLNVVNWIGEGFGG